MIDEKKYVKVVSSPAEEPKRVAEPVVIRNQDITITANGVYQAEDGYTGIGTATVNVQPPVFNGITKSVDSNGKLINSSTFMNLTGVTDIGDEVLYMAYYNNQNLSGTADMSSITQISGEHACRSMFEASRNFTGLNLSGLRTISGYQACMSMCYACSGLESVDVSNLETISGTEACSSMFSYCSSLVRVVFSKLSAITGDDALNSMFYGANGLEVSFPALTSNSFGEYTNQFDTLFYYGQNCIVHFPSNLQAVIGDWYGIQNELGGNNTTVLFDLPATE